MKFSFFNRRGSRAQDLTRLAEDTTFQETMTLWVEGSEIPDSVIADGVAGLLSEVDAEQLEARASADPSLAARIAEASALYEAPIPADVLDRLDRAARDLAAPASEDRIVKVKPRRSSLDFGVLRPALRDASEEEEVDGRS